MLPCHEKHAAGTDARFCNMKSSYCTWYEYLVTVITAVSTIYKTIPEPAKAKMKTKYEPLTVCNNVFALLYYRLIHLHW